MFGHLPATSPHAIRTGSWLAREALTDARHLRRTAAACCVIAVALATASFAAIAARTAHTRIVHNARPHLPAARHIPYPRLAWPLEISGSQYIPVAWTDIAGWSEDDHLQAYKAFRGSCRPIAAQRNLPADDKALGISLRDPCRAAKALDISDGAKARAFFEERFLPLRISRLGEDAGFVTGYYEPVLDGSRTQTDVYNVPVYRRPSNLFVRGKTQASVGLPNSGPVYRKIGRRKLVPYYDRGQIERGAIGGGRRAGRAADAGPVDRGRQGAACLRHAVLHCRRAADRIRAVQDAVPSPDDRAGYWIGDRRPGARRSLFRRRRGCRQGLGPAAA